MNSFFFEEEIEFFTVKGTNHGKIAWTSDGNFEAIATTALNWQSWLDENYESKKYLELCKELAKERISDLQKIDDSLEISLGKFSRNRYSGNFSPKISSRKRPITQIQKQSNSL